MDDAFGCSHCECDQLCSHAALSQCHTAYRVVRTKLTCDSFARASLRTHTPHYVLVHSFIAYQSINEINCIPCAICTLINGTHSYLQCKTSYTISHPKQWKPQRSGVREVDTFQSHRMFANKSLFTAKLKRHRHSFRLIKPSSMMHEAYHLFSCKFERCVTTNNANQWYCWYLLWVADKFYSNQTNICE